MSHKTHQRHCLHAGDPAVQDAARALPQLVRQALAHVLQYLQAFGQQTVLRLGAGTFQRMQSHMEMQLSPNTLQCAPRPSSSMAVRLPDACTSWAQLDA